MSPTQTAAWATLTSHHRDLKKHSLEQLRQADPARADRYRICTCQIELDYSRHHITDETLMLFEQLLNEQAWRAWQKRMFDGETINTSENRAVLHVALRGSYTGANGAIPSEVAATRERFFAFADAVRAGTVTGHSGKAITDVVNLGIGGSDLGPRLICHALAENTVPRVHFVANIDPVELQRVLGKLDPETTLFILSSKSFSTMETQVNATAAHAWLCAHYGVSMSDDQGVKHAHFCATSNNTQAASAWGILPERCYTLPEWVGGRFSLWSAIGLSIAIALGTEQFQQLLNGAKEMDEHFLTAPFVNNMPAMLAMLGIWYTNFHGAQVHGVISYAERLRYLPDYLQQLEMESNGKSINKQGESVDYATAPVLFGGLGTTTQHSFFQLLHQGRVRVPLDIISVEPSTPPAYAGDTREADLLLFAQAQSDALAYGIAALPDSLRTEWEKKPSYSHFPASQPSSRLHLNNLTPHTLGALIALYEHKTFLQGVVWNINSFDQWGVELGKVMFGAMKK